MQLTVHYRQHLVLRIGLLYQKVKSTNVEESKMQFVLPEKYRMKAIRACHNDMGHLGHERSPDLLKDHFFWLNIARDMWSSI